MRSSQFKSAVYDASLSVVADRALDTLDSIGDAVLSTDQAGNVTYLNAVAERMCGWATSDALGKPLQDVMRIINAETREPVGDPLAMAMRQDAVVALGANSLLIRRDGHEIPIEDTAAPIHDRNGQMTGAVIVFRDVGQALALTLRMSHLAQHDALTGLPNRLLLNDRLDRAIAAARRHGRSLAVLFMDLDGFKHINDRLGHAAGDRVLQSVASRLLASVRDSDTVSRQGGDEFVVLLAEVACAGDAAFHADKLRAALAAPHRIEGRQLHISASAGIGMYPADGNDAKELMRKADLDLLRVKARRRGGSFLRSPQQPVSSPLVDAAV